MMPAGLATVALSHCIENRKLFESSQMAKKIGRENSTHYPVRRHSHFMKYHTPLIIAALLASLFTGCSKHSPSAAAGSKVTALGVVEVSDGVQSRHDLGGGRVCLITPAIRKDGSIFLALQIEEAGKVLEPRGEIITDRDR